MFAFPPRLSPAAWGGLALLTATVMWGAAFPVSKAVLADMDPISMSLWRYGIAAPVFMALLAWREGAAALRLEGQGWKLLGLGTLGFAGFNLLMFYAVGMSRPEFGAIVMALQPLIAVLIQWVRSGQRPAARSFVALALAVVGVLLLTTDGHPARLTEHAALLPTLMMIAGGMCWVLYSMGAAAFPHWSPLRYTALSSSGGALGLVAFWLLAGAFGALRLPSAAALPALAPALLFLVLLAAVLAVLCWNQGMRQIGAQRGLLFINVVPLTALLIGVLRGHALGNGELIGAALVLVSLVLNQLGGQAGAKPSSILRPALATPK
ncbi:DMT family transporter [Uliginosibacterium sp. TH139]|uniref:DMT family transporter n=1 Tax=Uliginosibacterium sp. TH139 TaxID=2067453 RepID=UPI000C7E1B7F|nr:DMT family transporter [Uliginosibacterium sp. TH139]PLK50657.1 EamA family transporter [Uliginosibacterium sp. TH139]